MGSSVLVLPGACRQHVDRINQALAAGGCDEAFYLAYQYFRARVRHIQGKRRTQDADGFRLQGAHLLAGIAGEIHRSHPADEYRSGLLLVPGGDWQP